MGGIMFLRRSLLILMTLSLLILLVPACGGDDDDDETTSATSQATATTSNEPVKIGVLAPWSGPTAVLGAYYIDSVIKVIEKQVEEMGGILGGRQVEFVRFDTMGQVAQAAAGATKLITDDKVTVLAGGGAAGAEGTAIAGMAEKERVPFVSYMPIQDVADQQYTVVTSLSLEAAGEDASRLFTEVLTPIPDTAGVMVYDEPESRFWVNIWKQNIADAGIELVYEEYITHGITELSPYLTRIKYEDPDCLLMDLSAEQGMAIAKQIMDLGGWGDTQVVSFGNALSAAKMPGAEGWIVISPWHPSKDDPASVRFKDDFEAVNGTSPAEFHMYFYINLWTAIHAIELAGTDDPLDVDQAARSGHLEFDTPMGRAHFGTDGLPEGLKHMYVQIQKGGATVPFSQ